MKYFFKITIFSFSALLATALMAQDDLESPYHFPAVQDICKKYAFGNFRSDQIEQIKIELAEVRKQLDKHYLEEKEKCSEPFPFNLFSNRINCLREEEGKYQNDLSGLGLVKRAIQIKARLTSAHEKISHEVHIKDSEERKEATNKKLVFHFSAAKTIYDKYIDSPIEPDQNDKVIIEITEVKRQLNEHFSLEIEKCNKNSSDTTQCAKEARENFYNDTAALNFLEAAVKLQKLGNMTKELSD